MKGIKWHTAIFRTNMLQSIMERAMEIKKKYIYWSEETRLDRNAGTRQEGKVLLGYFDEFPEYVTWGSSLDDLKKKLRGMYREISVGEVAQIRRVSELNVDAFGDA